MYWTPWRWTREQWFGAWVAAAIAAAIAEIGYAIDAPLITVAGMSGLVIAWIVAGRYADRVLNGSSFVEVGLGVGFRTGLLTLTIWFVTASLLTIALNPEPLEDRLRQVAFAAFGVPIYGSIFGGPFVLLGGIAGALVLRTVRENGRAGSIVLAIASVGLAAGGVIAIADWL
ncbi:MAG: hypothetical protein H0U52_06975 [Chloroflexi bacterium]|nr:hypothetical protein [Chloroflexota bacterium]